MANTIRLKRASGSDPSASDLVTGELAVRTDTGKLFTKKDNGSVAEISGGGVDDGDKGDITVSNSGATFTIDNNAVTFAKIQDISHSRIIGRAVGSSGGNPDQLTATQVRAIINVEDGATADQTASDIKTLLNSSGLVNAQIDASAAIAGSKISPTFTADVVINNSEPKLKLTDSDNNSDFILLNSHGNFRIFDETNTAERFKIDSSGTGTFAGNLDVGAGIDVTGNITVSGTVDGRDLATDGSKLDGIESGATADQSASEILTLIKTVDGAGSGLDADTLDGISSASFLRSDAADTASGDITFSGGAGAATIAADSDIRFTNGDWTGNTCKIQQHGNALYMVGGSAGIIFREAGTDRWKINTDGDLKPASNNTYDLGDNSTRIANGYFVNLYGDGSNLTNLPSQTDNNFTNADHSKLDGIAAGATNVTNTNQLTNGAGFITATLTNEQVQDIVGGMVTGNTETGITVTYQDSDGTLDFVIGTLNQNTTGSSASCTGNSATATKLANARTIAGVSFDGSANISLNNNAITNGANYVTSSVINSLNASNLSSGTIPDARFPSTLPAISGANLTNLPSSSDNTKMPLSGGEFTGDVVCHTISPDNNNSRDLGSSSKRFRNVYVNDISLSNKGHSNKVDNTWGDFTIQEGAEDLFLINNRNGKMYKFLLKEVS
tara:strand:- start:1573 stop:3582 length:2010 start_codon:yes stop_codon:yes gene_type:complete